MIGVAANTLGMSAHTIDGPGAERVIVILRTLRQVVLGIYRRNSTSDRDCLLEARGLKAAIMTSSSDNESIMCRIQCNPAGTYLNGSFSERRWLPVVRYGDVALISNPKAARYL